jgi:5'(3')-deoxyribonucleotidase
MKSIAVDMDEVLADALGELLTRYNRETGSAITKADIEGKWLWQALPEGGQHRINEYLNSEDFFEDLSVFPESQDVLFQLARRYEIFIASAAMEFPNSFGPKYRWLRRNFPFLDPHRFVFCGTKSILHADFLIDDMPRNLSAFSGKGIMFSAPHNVRVGGFPRVNDWRDVAKMFL